MLNVGKIEEGFVLDHIKAGKSLSIYEHLQLANPSVYLGAASSNSYKTLQRKPERIQPSVAVLHGVRACLSEDWSVP